jgi:hypothetical protein
MRRLWILLAVVLATGGVVAWFARSSDDEQIRAQLTRLAAALHKSQGSNVILRATKMRGEFDAILDQSPHVTIPDLPTSLPDDRRGLADSATQVTALVQSLDLDFSDVEIKTDEAHMSAQVNATATLKADGDPPRRAKRPVTFLFWKREGTWRISAVTVWNEPPAS